MPSRRQFLRSTSAVLSVATVGGCASDLGSTIGEETLTEPGTGEKIPYPDGWNGTGVADVETARQSHVSALGDRSYRIEIDQVLSKESPDYTTVDAYFVVDPDAQTFVEHRNRTRHVRFRDDFPEYRDRYVTNGTEYYRFTNPESERSPEYSTESYAFEHEKIWTDAFKALGWFEFDVVDVSDSDVGHVVTYEVDSLTKSGRDRFEADEYDFSGRVTLRSDGLLRSMDIGSGDRNDTWAYIVSLETTEIGEATVSEPDWRDELE